MTPDTIEHAWVDLPSRGASRRAVWTALAAAPLTHGLPCPLWLEVADDHGALSVSVRCDDGDTAGVDGWAGWLRLDPPRLGARLSRCRVYGATAWSTPDRPLWRGCRRVDVWCAVRDEEGDAG